MKRIAAILLCMCMVVLLTSCISNKPPVTQQPDMTSAPTRPEGPIVEETEPVDKTKVYEEPTTIRIAGLKGPTSMGMVKLMEESDEGETEGDYEFTLAGSADEVTPKLVKGDLDIAAVPANLACVLYNNTQGQVDVIAVNTLGVLYLVSKDVEISSIKDLKGKTIYGAGKGSTPEYTLRYILEKNGIDPDNDVTIEWKSEHTEVVQAMATSDDAIGLLPQPFVTVAKSQIEGIDIAVDLNEEWNKIGDDSQLVTGVLVARRDFLDKYPQATGQFIREYADSVEWVNENVDDAAALIDKYGIVKEDVAKEALPKCNIVCITGMEMTNSLYPYLTILYNENPEAIGGNLPGPDFFKLFSTEQSEDEDN